MTENFIASTTLLFVLLNPFLMSIYLLDLLRETSTKLFSAILVRASIISGIVFVFFTWIGDKAFSEVFHVRFASFLIFGGIIFVIIGLRFVLLGTEAISSIRGPAEHVAGAVAMPFIIGPGTVSAAVLTGQKLPPYFAALSILMALALSAISLILLKILHDYVKKKKEKLIERYIEVVGRISALYIGSYAVEMILQGIELWSKNPLLPLS